MLNTQKYLSKAWAASAKLCRRVGDVAKAQEQFNVNKSNNTFALGAKGKEIVLKYLQAEQAKLDDLKGEASKQKGKVEEVGQR